MIKFQPFEMEAMMSQWENTVQYNLSESGVHPLRLADLVDEPELVHQLLATELNYPQANGLIELRERIASLYPGATADQVLVTVGAAEANFVTLQTLLAAGDEMVMMLPNYMQIWGLAYNAGLCVKTFNLDEACGWKPDLEQLRQAVTNRTKLIAICNPNNPTGYILSAAEMDAIVAAADRVGAWILADEVYSGAERMADVQTPSFWGRYDKVLAINSLSKAYGLPGLRIGWVVCPAGTAGEVWRRHEYTTISATMLANKLATLALTPTTRIRLIQRTRACVRQGYALLDAWINTHDGILDVVPPQAAAIAFVRYHLPINSTALVERLRKEKSVLVVPGDHFGLDHHLRISFGPPSAYLQAGLGRIHELITNLASG